MTHYDDFIAARSRQCFNCLNSHMESHFRAVALGRVDCKLQSENWHVLLQDDGAYWWKPKPTRSQERIEELGWASGEVTSTPDMKNAVSDTQRYGGQAEESRVEEDSEVDQQQDVPAQFGRLENTVRDGHNDGHMQADGRSGGKADAGNALLQREADAFHLLMPRLIVDADSGSDESVIGRSRVLRVELGMRAESLVMKSWSGMQLELVRLTGRPEIETDTPTARGATKRSG